MFCASCVKKTTPGTQQLPDAAVVGSWKLVQVDGTIDSSITVNGTKNTTKMTLSFDSVSNKYTNKVNDNVVYQYPYQLFLTFNANSSDQVIEKFIRPGTVDTALLVIDSFWNYTTTTRLYDGMVIKGFEKTTAFGYYKVNPATSTGSNIIGSLLTAPAFSSYDVRSGHFYLYVHLQFIGNPTLNINGTTSNPAVQINADYVLTFTKTKNVPKY